MDGENKMTEQNRPVEFRTFNFRIHLIHKVYGDITAHKDWVSRSAQPKSKTKKMFTERTQWADRRDYSLPASSWFTGGQDQHHQRVI